MFWTAGALLLLLALPGLLDLRLAPLELLANLRPQIALAALVFAIAALTLGRYWTAGVGAALVALLLMATPEFFDRPSPVVTRPTLKVVWANVFKTDAAVARLTRLADREGADVVILAEAPSDKAGARRTLAAFPYVHEPTNPEHHGAVIFSRRPLEPLPGWDASGRYPVTVVKLDGLTLIAMHPPVAVTPHLLSASETMMRQAADQAEGPSLVIGDMNATPWSRRIRALSAKLHRVSPGAVGTWFSSLPLLGLPIDHAFVSEPLRASARVGPGIGSDHLPLIVSIQTEQ